MARIIDGWEQFGRGVARRAAREPWLIGLLLWAGFWTWFGAAVVVSEGGRGGGGWALAILVCVLWGSVAAVARWRRVGGVALCFVGLASAVFFGNVWALLLFSLPAALLGVWAISRRM